MTKWYNKVLIYDVETTIKQLDITGYVCTDNPHLFTGTHYDFAENSMRETLYYDTITNLLLEHCVDEKVIQSSLIGILKTFVGRQKQNL